MDENRENLSGQSDPVRERKAKTKRTVAILCIFLVIVGVRYSALRTKRLNAIMAGGSSYESIPGEHTLYPKIAVNGEIYWWYKGENKWMLRHVFWKWKKPGVVSELPEDCVWYGEIKHVPGNKPTDDCEMVSIFPASGQIYVFPDDPSVCFVVITALALDREIVPFYYENPGYFSADNFD